MGRKLLLTLAALATGIVLAAGLIRIIAGAPGAQTAGWQIAAQAYLQHEATKKAAVWEIAAAEEAARPWEFQRAMSGRSFGGSTYYQVNTPYTGNNGPRPLPMPPVAVWCVRLKAAAETSGLTARFVFVAKHQDLYNADWITHEPPGDPAQPPAEVLAKIGCRDLP